MFIKRVIPAVILKTKSLLSIKIKLVMIRQNKIVPTRRSEPIRLLAGLDLKKDL